MKKGKIAKLAKITLIVIRINSRGQVCNSKPCINCVNSIRKFNRYIRLHRIMYSLDDGVESVSIDKLESTHISRAFRVFNKAKKIKS